MKKQKIIIMLLIITMVLCILVPKSNAALQADGSTGTTQSLNNWMINIRKMESIGGTLGLTETINSNLTSGSGSNNLDIHMQKNTEYGAIAILSASSYGNPNKIASGETTTGNETGIVMNLNKEWVAAGSLTGVTTFANADGRYKNVYTGDVNYGSGEITTMSYTAKIGDAISETAGWHGSTSSVWLTATWGYGSNPADITSVVGLVRAYSGSIFSYYGKGVWKDAVPHSDNAYYANPWYSRAIMVCGEGI